MARTTKLTPKVSQTTCDAIGEGISLEGAAELANVSPSTAYEWLSRGLGEDPRGREQTKVAEDGARNRRVEPEQTPEKGMRFAGGPAVERSVIVSRLSCQAIAGVRNSSQNEQGPVVGWRSGWL